LSLSINGETVDSSVIKAEERTIRPQLQAAMPDEDHAAIEARVRQWARENIIERVVLRQAALADPEPVPSDAIDGASEAPGQAGARIDLGDDGHRKEIEVRLRIERIFSRVTAHLAPARNKDVVDYYRKNRESLAAPRRVHAAHIVKNVDERTSEDAARTAVEEIERRLRAGESFEQLADAMSDCPGRGGDLGTFPPGQMVPEFDAVVFNMRPGEVSPIFRTSFGFHIAKVYEVHPEGIPELNEVRAQIEQLLFERKRQRSIEEYLDRLIAKAEVHDV